MSRSKSQRAKGQRPASTKASVVSSSAQAVSVQPEAAPVVAHATTKSGRSTPKRRRSNLMWIYGAVAVVILFAALPLYRTFTQVQVGEAVTIMTTAHVPANATTNYNSNPPTSGVHTAETVPWSTSASELPDISLVHNLEHGGIVLQYKPDLDANQRQQLTDLASDLRRTDRKVVLAPRPANDVAITATAWGRVLKLDTFDSTQLRTFFETNRNRSPEREPS